MARRFKRSAGVSAGRRKTTATFEVSGLKEFEASLAELGKATARNVMLRALVDSAEEIALLMRDKAPVKYGNLVKSILVAAKSTANAGKRAFYMALRAGASRTVAGAAAKSANKAAKGRDTFSQVFVGPGPDGFHGSLQEFGTAKMAAQPFARPAFDEGAPKALARLSSDLENQISKAAQRAARKAARRARL